MQSQDLAPMVELAHIVQLQESWCLSILPAPEVYQKVAVYWSFQLLIVNATVLTLITYANNIKDIKSCDRGDHFSKYLCLKQ